jgi:hypothetical protein
MKMPKHDRVTVIGKQWPMREAMVLAQVADVVVGQETGLLNAVAMEPMRKVVLLSHSTHENLTQHWVNTQALTGDVPCYPCHRIHLTFDKCVVDEKTGCAACQAAIAPEEVLSQVLARSTTASSVARRRRKGEPDGLHHDRSATLEDAIATGQLTVEYDGKRITYRSIDDLIKARDLVRGELIAAGAITDTTIRRSVTSFSKD